MKKFMLCAAVVALLVVAFATTAQAGTFYIDLADDNGSASGWDVVTGGGGSGADDFTTSSLTDQSGGGDNDVTITITDLGGEGTTGAPGSGTTVGGVTVPKEANDDYVWAWDWDTGSSADLLFEFKNLDAGDYDVYVFEGRTSDGNGQYGKIWVGTEPGSENTGDYAGGSSSKVSVTITAGDSLFFKNLEDGTGGTSGIIIVPEPATLALMALGGVGLVLRRKRK